MFARLTANGRLFGFDIGDWFLLVGGCMTAGLLTLARLISPRCLAGLLSVRFKTS
jgi:hypothetical protein